MSTTSVRPAWLSLIAGGLILLLLVGIAALLVQLLRRPKYMDDEDAGPVTPVSLGVGKPVGLIR